MPDSPNTKGAYRCGSCTVVLNLPANSVKRGSSSQDAQTPSPGPPGLTKGSQDTSKVFKWIGITLCALVGLVCVGELVRRHPELTPTAEEALHLLIAILGLLAVITWINLTDTIQSLRG